MRITEITMTHFGKFHGKTMTFQPGVNIIYGKNEAGKSTIHTFIQGMLFGIEKQRGRASKNDTYSKYEPWENRGGYGGVLRFVVGGTDYRIERSFLKSDKWVRLIDETHGKELTPAQEQIEALLYGMNETSYRNTVSVAQMKAQTEAGLADELKNYIANLNNAGNLEVNLSAAEDALKAKRRLFQSLQDAEVQKRSVECREETDFLEKQSMVLERKRREAEESLAALRKKRQSAQQDADGREAVYQAARRQNDEKRETLEKELSQMTGGREARRRKNIAGPFLMLFGLLAAILALLNYRGSLGTKLPDWLVLTGCGAAAALFFLGIWMNSRHSKKEEQDQLIFEKREELRRLAESSRKAAAEYRPPDRSALAEMEQEEQRLQNEANRAQWEQEKCQEELVRLGEELEELEQEMEENEKRSKEIEALDLALSMMENLSGRIQDSFGNRLQALSSELISQITGGKYEKLVIQEDLSVSINTRDRLIPLEQVSRGTMEQIYLAVRLAAARVLWPKESMPVIVDDLFAHYDDLRLKRTLEMFQKNENQLILFTCHRREEEQLGI